MRKTMDTNGHVRKDHFPTAPGAAILQDVTSVQDPGALVLERLSEVASVLEAGSVHETLQRIVDLAVDIIPGCEHAGVSLVHHGKIATPAASDAVALRVDAIQYEVGEGPCLDAIAESQSSSTDDLCQEARWPKFSARAQAETGVTSMLAFRLFARGHSLGALILLSKNRAAFGEEAHEIGALFATLAAAALAAAQTEEGLNVALRSRDVIGQAKGILMERHRITEDQAFDILKRSSQRLNVRLAGVAEGVTRTGESPATS
jgi:transcriptional regulator with GAF, ATPase, and Fis domain